MWYKNSFTHGRRTGPFFSKFYTVRFSQTWLFYHLKIFKKYEFSQNLEVVAQKLHPPCLFQFWTSQGRGSPIFWGIPHSAFSSFTKDLERSGWYQSALVTALIFHRTSIPPKIKAIKIISNYVWLIKSKQVSLKNTSLSLENYY